MWTAGRTAKKIFHQPGAFALAVIKQFRANQGVPLAGAVAYYTLLSLVPLLILILMALSHIVPEDRLLLTLSEYLEFVVPGQSAALSRKFELSSLKNRSSGQSCSLRCFSLVLWHSPFSKTRCL
jgi:uncharacterized BrkB/YihY/UPF0761 family membrane protein